MRICTACGHPFEATDWHCPSCDFEPPLIEGFPALHPELALGGGGFNPEYFGSLARLEANHFWFRARNEILLWAIRRYHPKIERYLEIGCGTGFVLSAIADTWQEAKITGSEVFSAGLAYAAQRVPRAELIQMDARQIPYKEQFDVIGAYDVIEHIDEDEEVLRAMHNAIRPGGGVVITVPQHQWLWSRQDELACHVRRYTQTELHKKIERAGFKLRFSTSFVSLLLPILWLSRKLLAQRSAEEHDPMAELRIGNLANKVLGTTMSAEISLLKTGLRLPAGGSLLIVASRQQHY